MSEQDNGKVTSVATPPPPTSDDPKAWRSYWKAQGHSWRTEPEIDVERQKYLAERRNIIPNIEQGIYPFKDMKLSRADVEWLLATHEDGKGPVDWSDESQQRRQGIDVRGADLRQIDLSFLPLTRMLGSLKYTERNNATLEQRTMATVRMDGVNLKYAHLEGAYLHDVHLEEADFTRAFLERANLRGAHLDRAILGFAHLKGAYLRGASLKKTNLRDVFLGGARLNDVILSDERGVGPLVADAHWDEVNVTVVQWLQIRQLGDEYEARQKTCDGQVKDKSTRLDEHKEAVRANRQLANILQAQGLNEDAAGFAYRAQKLQRIVLRRQKKFGQYILSGFLDLLAGYGYHPLRTLFWYALVICTFALAYHYVWVTYHLEKVTHHPLSYVGAFVFSITAFHGRGFFLGGDFGYDSLITILAAIEAVIGLIIEFSFIATFTQRFFGK